MNWETSNRLFVEDDGNLPEESNDLLSFIDAFPPDVPANVLMHMDMPAYEKYDEIKTHAAMLVKIMQKQRRRPRTGVNMVDAYRGEPPQEPEPTGDNDNDFDDDVDISMTKFQVPRHVLNKRRELFPATLFRIRQLVLHNCDEPTPLNYDQSPHSHNEIGS